MRSVILMSTFAAAIFSASAAGSWFYQSNLQKSSSAGLHATSASAFAAGDATTTPDNLESPATTDLPVPVRPRPMSVEEVLRFGLGLRKREKRLNEREESLNQQQERLQLALADIRTEQQQIEGFQAKLDGQTQACQTLVAEIHRAREQLAAERAEAAQELSEFEDVRIETSEQELQNIKRMSEWFQSMEPEKAAGALEELVNDGKTELAVKLLANFEERDAAKILSALDDFALMVERAERFKDLKRPEKKPRPR